MEIRINASKESFDFQTLCYTLTAKSFAKEQKERFFPLFDLMIGQMKNKLKSEINKGDDKNEER